MESKVNKIVDLFRLLKEAILVWISEDPIGKPLIPGKYYRSDGFRFTVSKQQAGKVLFKSTTGMRGGYRYKTGEQKPQNYVIR